MKSFIFTLSITLFFQLLLSSCSAEKQKITSNQTKQVQAVKQKSAYKMEIIDSYPHDSLSYTQGLFVKDGFLYESSGQYGQSSIRKTEIETGKVIQKQSVSAQYFTEGLAFADDKYYQLTWTNGICFVYGNDFKQIGKITYAGEGWGLTNYGNDLIMSDGSNFLRIIDKLTFNVKKTIPVYTADSKPVNNLNELEFAKGKIFANIYMQDAIAIINPETGNTEDIIDISILRSELKNNPTAEVSNGIAYNQKEDVFYLTGKYWNKIFKVKIYE